MRITRHQLFMEIAHVLAKRSTCPRLNVGAVVVVNSRIVSVGYNGAPPGEPHCTEAGCLCEDGGCRRTVHAEINALNYVPDSVRGSESSLYVTDSPCMACARAISEHNDILWLYYGQPYRDTAPLIYLIAMGVEVFRVVPSGYTISEATGQVIREAKA